MSRSARRSVLENTGALYALEVSGIAISLLLVPYLVAQLGLEGYGRLVLGLAVGQAAAVLVRYGFDIVALRRVAREPEALPEVFASVVLGRLSLWLLSGLACLVGYAVLYRSLPPLPFAVLAMAIAGESVFFPTWAFQALERMGWITVLSVTGRLFGAAALVAMVRGPDDLGWAALLSALPYVLTGVFGMAVAIRGLGAVPEGLPSRETFSVLARDAGTYFLGSLAGQVHVRGTIFLVAAVVDDATTGLFAIAQRAVGMIGVMMQPPTKALFPQLCRRWVEDFPAVLGLHARLLLALVGFALAMASAAAGLLGPVVGWVTDDTGPIPAALYAYLFVGVASAANVVLVRIVASADGDAALRWVYTGSAVTFALGGAVALGTRSLGGVVGTIWLVELYCLAVLVVAYRGLRRARRKTLRSTPAPPAGVAERA